MDEKPIAGIVTAIIIAPLVALCCLGPLVIGSALGGVVGWFSGQGLGLTAVLVFSAGAVGYAVTRWRRASSREGNAGLQDVSKESAKWRNGEMDDIGRAPEDKCRCP
jgi:uncharacterized protein YcfJ